MRIFKIVLFNLIGLIAGILVGNITLIVTRWLFIDLLGSIKLITAVLSWPVDYSTYAITGIITADAAASLYVCSVLCRIGKGRLNYACILVGLYEIVIFMITVIKTISQYGFSFDVLWMILFILGIVGSFSVSFAKCEE